MHTETLVLMLVVLSWNEPADAVGAEDSIDAEAGYKQHREHKEPVDASDGNRRQRSGTVFLQHGRIRTRFETWRTHGVSM